MSIIDSSTKFVGINPDFPTAERKSAQVNAAQQVVTMEDIIDTVDEALTAPTLQSVTDQGNTTTNEIQFGSAVGILLDNNSRLREGTIDAQSGGSKGIAQICAVGYELKWEAGSQYVMDGNGTLIREVNHKFNIIPDVNNDSTEGFYVGSRWILDNGDVYVCTDSTATAAVWSIVPNADWNATTGSSAIANKPTIPSTSGFVPYTGATNDLDMGTHNVTADHISLNVSPSGAGFVVGSTQWNNTIGSSETLLKGGNVTLKNGVDLVARIVNKVTPNTTLTKANYQAVRVSGAQGGRLAVNLAQANNDNNSADTIGLVTETIATNQEGFIITVGQLEDINTTGSLQGETWADGDVLYLSPTVAGKLTNIKPTGATGHIVVMGYVEYSHAVNGKIYVKVMNGWELDELHNVSISSVADNNILQYDSATSLWKNESLSTAGIQPTLVSATNIKTINGTTLLGSGDLIVGASSGVFGITNSSGVYTYYATLTLAMAAATSGQTIVMFANVTETGAVEITLKDGVNINGNGYTYTLNNSGSSHAFKVTNSTSINCSIINLNVIRTGSTGTQLLNTCLYSGNSTSGNIYLTGSKFTNTGSGSGVAIGSASTISIYDGTAIANTTFGSIYIESSAGAKIYNSTGISTSQAGINCYIGGDLFNCTGISSSGIGIDGAGATTAGNQYNCIGISATSTGLTTGAVAINCIGRSISGNGISSMNPSKVHGCVGISVSGRGISNVSSSIYNSQGISSSGVGFLLQTSTAVLFNCLSKSDSSYSIWGWNGSKIYNSIIECNWNNAGGNGVQGISGFITNTIVNCVFRLANATAPYLNNGGTAQAISMRGNTYQGGGAFNINLTQAIVAVQDAQGNIFL